MQHAAPQKICVIHAAWKVAGACPPVGPWIRPNPGARPSANHVSANCPQQMLPVSCLAPRPLLRSHSIQRWLVMSKQSIFQPIATSLAANLSANRNQSGYRGFLMHGSAFYKLCTLLGVGDRQVAGAPLHDLASSGPGLPACPQA